MTSDNLYFRTYTYANYIICLCCDEDYLSLAVSSCYIQIKENLTNHFIVLRYPLCSVFLYLSLELGLVKYLVLKAYTMVQRIAFLCNFKIYLQEMSCSASYD